MSQIPTDNYDGFTSTLARDFLDLVCGDIIGVGSTRVVRRSILTPEYIFKFEDEAGRFQNIIEWDVWDRVKLTKHAKWFAPCLHISACGTVLIQEYAKDITDDALLPEEVPVYFTDLKKANFGIIDNQVVCRDYGYNLLVERGLTNKMKRADW